MHHEFGWLISVALVMVSVNAHAQDNEGNNETPISFEASTCFEEAPSDSSHITFVGSDPIDLSPFGDSLLEWELTLTTDEFALAGGWFKWTLPSEEGQNQGQDDRNTLYGTYTDFSLDPLTGDYTIVIGPDRLETLVMFDAFDVRQAHLPQQEPSGQSQQQPGVSAGPRRSVSPTVEVDHESGDLAAAHGMPRSASRAAAAIVVCRRI